MPSALLKQSKGLRFLRSVAAAALCPKSFLPRDWLTHVNFATLRVAQFAAAPPRRTATRPKARAALRRRRTASPQPEICAENLKKSPENTKNNKKSMQIVVRFNYSYYFWGSDPSEKT